jgi:glutathione synthase/RimK-type ligase-like ATP-grasp enzyme
VLKVGHAHAGYGKVRVRDHHDFEDLRGLVALHGDYSTTEPFLQGEFDLRIQKIGDQYRVFKRTGSGTNWKTNTGSSVLEELDVTPKYKLWADECSRMFGGLDILAVDAIHTKDGKEFILEMNDGSIGLAPEREDADNKAIRNLVITRLREAYPAKTKH